ncbi:hypothetical protein ACSXBP_11280 [Clostridium perfringens]|uniref:chromosome partitioning protein ParA n=1 Tax=Clostridium perfringens TaxID=1502 RepID=UPI00189933AE|nr:chromosome partitioning protein ParA [Clostridium perfringens]HAT4093263.1 chromosome partitioning protein ParA [Clostridium perfringens]
MKSIYLPKLLTIEVSDYSFYEQEPSFKFNFSEGISSIIGANGVGKTTFINMIIYSLVGFKKDFKGKSKNKKINYTNVNYFKNRLNNEKYSAEFNSNASVTLEFKLNISNIKITRSLIENKIIFLKVNDKIFDDISLSSYENLICKLSNIPFFKDFELIIRQFLLFDESRKNVSWEIDTQGEILRILLLENDLYTKYSELQEKITIYDSKGRHESENQRMAEESYRDLIKSKESLFNKNEEKEKEYNNDKVLIENKFKISNDIKELKDTINTNNKLISELVDKNNYLLGDKDRININLEKIEERLEKSESKLYASYYETLPDYYYTIENALSKKGECLICGAKSKELKEINNLRIKNNECLICSSPIKMKNSVDENLIDKINELNKEKQININKIENIERDIKLNYNTISKYKKENESCLKKLDLNKNELIIIENKISSKNANEDVDTYTTILKAKKDLISKLEANKKHYYDLRSKAEEEFNIYLNQYKTTIENLNNNLSSYFNKYAQTFIGWNCELTVQKKVIKKIPHYYYLPLVDKSIRESPDAVSESQRFFLDQAFRMAIINFMQDNIENFSTFFITETPEGSLDMVYESQVAEMFLKFANTNNNIIFTSNLNSSSFLNKLFNNFSSDEKEEKILNLLEKSRMSNLQMKNREALDFAISKLYRGDE